ncbi:MAG: hypothetical protein Q8P41_13510 [Pseudomonadota bacterium]|nr:hypothetical protein [Pseudomonadota bacterium]
MPLFGLALVAAFPAAAETWAPGETIEKAAYADLTPEGLNAISALIPALLPSGIEIPETSAEGGYWCFNYAYGLYGAWVSIEVVNATITPGNGVLDITANLMVSLNDPSDTFQLYYELTCLDDTCDGYVDAFPVTVTTTMALEVVDDGAGNNVLDATIGAINVSYELVNDDIHLDNCSVGDIESVLDWFGLSLYDLILGQLDSYLQDAIADIGPTLEETIEDAFSSASINQELDLNGAVVQLSLQPSDVVITPAGVRVQMSGSMSGDASTCIGNNDPGGSLKTLSDAPAIGQVPSSIEGDYHVGLILSDDFTNQALYSLWRGGLLCYSLEPGGAFPLDTSILNVLTGSVFAELFPETQPLTLQTAPGAPPTTSFDGGHDIDVNLTDLGLELYTQLDGREAKIVTVALAGVVGVDLGFDNTTGELGVIVDLDANALTPSVVYNEFFPDANEAIVAGFSGAFGGIIDTVVGGLLDGLVFAVPSFSGIGLTALEAAPVGDNADWLGAFAWVGPTTYEAADGCGSEGCSSGCSGGCASSPGSVGLWPALGLLLLLRRRS